MRQKITDIDQLHQSNQGRQAVLPCGQYNGTLQIVKFQDASSAGDVRDSQSTSEGVPCVFVSDTFVPVSHSSAESEIISLDAGLRMDGLPALQFWWKHYPVGNFERHKCERVIPSRLHSDIGVP